MASAQGRAQSPLDGSRRRSQDEGAALAPLSASPGSTASPGSQSHTRQGSTDETAGGGAASKDALPSEYKGRRRHASDGLVRSTSSDVVDDGAAADAGRSRYASGGVAIAGAASGSGGGRVLDSVRNALQFRTWSRSVAPQTAPSLDDEPETEPLKAPLNQDELERQIVDTERKLEKELKLRAGAETLSRHYVNKKTGDRKHTAEAINILQEAEQRVEKLSALLERLRADHAEMLGLDPIAPDPDSQGSERPMSQEQVTARIQRIRERIDIETTVKIGAEKLAKAMGKSMQGTEAKADRQEKEKSMLDIFKSLTNVNAKLVLLNAALSKYQNMTRFTTSTTSDSGGVATGLYSFSPFGRMLPPSLHTVMSSPALVTGTGTGSPAAVSASSPTGPASPIASPALPRRLMNLSSSSTASTAAPPLAPLSQPRTNLTGKLAVRLFDARGLHPERLLEGVFCVVKVDSTVRAKTKSKFKVAMPSWNEAISIKLEKAHDFEVEIMEGADLRGLVFFRLEECMQEWSLSGVLNAYFTVEPFGQLHMELAFSREILRTTRRLSQMNRRMALRKKKNIASNGHSFQTTRFYQLVKCAVCGELMFSTSGYQCLHCGCACHRKCHLDVKSKCTQAVAQGSAAAAAAAAALAVPATTTAATAIDAGGAVADGGTPAATALVVRAHRFEVVAVGTPTFCAHCGLMLPIGKKKTHKCKDCGATCHPRCEPFLPDRCTTETERGDRDRRSSALSIVANLFARPRSTSQSDMTSTPPTRRSELAARIAEVERLEAAGGDEAAAAASAHVAGTSRRPSGSRMNSEVAEGKTDEVHPAFNRYTLLRMLGRGNFGKVLLVEEKRTGDLFAMKVLKKDFVIENDELSSLRTERLIFQVANRERHPFLLPMHECFQTSTRLVFITDYIPGGDLMMHIQRASFSLDRVCFYAAEVLLALECLHKNNVIYRDLKLDNILLGVDGHIRLADYGLCKALDKPDGMTNTFCGTPEFMAPEILREVEYGRAVDWWAFGVLLYEMLLSESPFDGQDEDEIFRSILTSEIKYPATLQPHAASLLRKLLVRDPQSRLGSSHRDAEDIKRHVFFRSIDWDKLLRREIPAPYRPAVFGKLDVGNFDRTFTTEPAVLTPVTSVLSAADQEEFDGFEYTAPWVNHDAPALPAGPVSPRFTAGPASPRFTPGPASPRYGPGLASPRGELAAPPSELGTAALLQGDAAAIPSPRGEAGSASQQNRGRPPTTAANLSLRSTDPSSPAPPLPVPVASPPFVLSTPPPAKARKTPALAITVNVEGSAYGDKL